MVLVLTSLSRLFSPLPPYSVGHAGAVISGGKGKAEDKVAALEKAGVIMVDSPAKLGSSLKEVRQHFLSFLSSKHWADDVLYRHRLWSPLDSPKFPKYHSKGTNVRRREGEVVR